MIGEPDAGNPHVRFDEGRQETCVRVARLSPTLRSVPGFFHYGSRNYTPSIHEVLIDGDHPGGVISPPHGQPPIKSEG